MYSNSLYMLIDAVTLMQPNALSIPVFFIVFLDLVQSGWGHVYCDGCCFQGLPVVLLVGDVTIGRKLLKALGHAESGDTATGVIKNKYYAARVQQPGKSLKDRQTSQIQHAKSMES